MTMAGEMIKVKANGKKYSFRKLQQQEDGTFFILYHGETLLVVEQEDGTWGVIQNEAAEKVKAEAKAKASGEVTPKAPKAKATKTEPKEPKDPSVIEPPSLNPALTLPDPVVITADEDSLILKLKAELEKVQEEVQPAEVPVA